MQGRGGAKRNTPVQAAVWHMASGCLALLHVQHYSDIQCFCRVAALRPHHLLRARSGCWPGDARQPLCDLAPQRECSCLSKRFQCWTDPQSLGHPSITQHPSFNCIMLPTCCILYIHEIVLHEMALHCRKAARSGDFPKRLKSQPHVSLCT